MSFLVSWVSQCACTNSFLSHECLFLSHECLSAHALTVSCLMSVIECLSSTLYFSRYPKNLPWLLWGGSREPLWHQTWAPPRTPPPSLHCTGTENQSKTMSRFWIGWCSQRQKPKRWTLGKSWNTFVFLLIYWAKGFPFLWRVEANSTSRQLVLESKELWDQFHVIGTEMIVTKAGRYVWKIENSWT